MIKIFNQSKINLNLSNASRGDIRQIKGRDFEIPGCGAFLLTEYSKELEDYYVLEEEISTYNDIHELIHKCRYYLDHEEQRKKIADNGHQRVLTEHTYVHRFCAIFDTIMARP